MRDLNRIILMGRLGADPVKRQTQKGTPVTHFPLATSSYLKGSAPSDNIDASDEKPMDAEKRTQWHHIVVWGKNAEICSQYLRKGSAVYLEGELRSHLYENKEGQKKRAFEVHTSIVNFIGPAAQAG